jgi:chorismate mutase
MDIPGWRKKIDELDRRIVELLNARALAAKEIGRLKRNSELPIYEPVREKTIFENVGKANTGPLPDKDLQHIFERIIDVMRAIQKEEIVPAKESTSKGGGTEFDVETNE